MNLRQSIGKTFENSIRKGKDLLSNEQEKIFELIFAE